MKSWLVLVLVFFSLSEMNFCQPSKIRMGIKSGSRIDFIFNTIDKYINSGITYSNFTKITIDYTDGGALNDSLWYLWIVPNTANISDGTNTLPLSTINVKVENTTTGSIDCCAIFQPVQIPNLRLVQDGIEGGYAVNNVTISWKCGPFATFPNPGVYVLDLIVLVTNDINVIP